MTAIRNALLRSIVAVAVLAISGTNAQAVPILLDDFTVPAALAGPNLGPGIVFGPTGGIGGLPATRTISTSVLGVPIIAGQGVSVGAGILALSTQDVSATVQVDYTFADHTFFAANSLDMTFTIVDGGIGSGNMLDVTFQILDGAVVVGSQNANVPNGAGLIPLSMPFSNFGGGPFNNIDGIRLIFNGNPNVATDFTLGAGGVFLQNGDVPEPATLATFGLVALVGGVVARRKLKARAALG
jgi:hypothetical protein